MGKETGRGWTGRSRSRISRTVVGSRIWWSASCGNMGLGLASLSQKLLCWEAWPVDKSWKGQQKRRWWAVGLVGPVGLAALTPSGSGHR